MRKVNSNIAIWAVLVVSLVIWGIVLLLAGTKFDLNGLWNALKQLPLVVSIDGVLWLVFAKWLWRWRVFQGWLVPSPVLDGTWQGTLQTTWRNPETGEVPGPIPTILVIRQSLLHTSCTMYTAEMSSHSYAASFLIGAESGSRKLTYTYTSTPGVTVRHRSPVHDGTALLEITTLPSRKLHGEYWTARGTTGAIDLTFRSTEFLQAFPDDLLPGAAEKASQQGRGRTHG